MSSTNLKHDFCHVFFIGKKLVLDIGCLNQQRQVGNFDFFTGKRNDFVLIELGQKPDTAFS